MQSRRERLRVLTMATLRSRRMEHLFMSGLIARRLGATWGLIIDSLNIACRRIFSRPQPDDPLTLSQHRIGDVQHIPLRTHHIPCGVGRLPLTGQDVQRWAQNYDLARPVSTIMQLDVPAAHPGILRGCDCIDVQKEIPTCLLSFMRES
jgi:hypothetical protein